MRKYLLMLFAALFLITGCSRKKSVNEMTPEELRAYATELADRFIITDGHVDLPYMLQEKKVLISEATIDTLVSTTMGEFDFERARKGDRKSVV